MKNIYTWAAQPAQRNITIGDIIAAKGKKVDTYEELSGAPPASNPTEGVEGSGGNAATPTGN